MVWEYLRKPVKRSDLRPEIFDFTTDFRNCLHGAFLTLQIIRGIMDILKIFPKEL